MTGDLRRNAEEDAVGGEATMTPADATTLTTLRLMWQERDPVPPDLADRVCFVLSMANLEAELMELMELTAGFAEPVGAARAEEQARNITFTSDTLSVMVTISLDGPLVRLDGWIGDGGGLGVALRQLPSGGRPATPGERSTAADEDGRFAFPGLDHGLVQLVFHPTAGAQLTLTRPVVTPAVQI